MSIFKYRILQLAMVESRLCISLCSKFRPFLLAISASAPVSGHPWDLHTLHACSLQGKVIFLIGTSPRPEPESLIGLSLCHHASSIAYAEKKQVKFQIAQK